ncbi:coiled-coil domain-containing protein 189-like [Xenia sp. Carnegie-2017]|uniref:coiled-coil domain-containing protein 189-like n=1 Tax=Xenia sp. Carnegie-2017 TaxID=2897299 RepID=UPI001F03E990|nr:coiled-coil domain-containing protein 189-like [Xenia sp. Carnegie-2017]
MMPVGTVKSKKPSILLWHDLDVQQLCVLKESTDKLKTLAEMFSLKNYKDDLKSAILLDLYFYTIQFALKNGFNDEQTSGFFSMIKSVHEMAVETPYGNVDDVYDYFKELLLCHSLKRPPFSVELFSSNQVQAISDYVTNTYFKHFKLYKYTFTAKVRLDLRFEYANVPETPPPDDEESVENEGKDNAGEVNDEEDNSSHVNEDVDSPALKELKNFITATLNEQIKQLRLTIDEEIASSNEKLSQKLGFAEKDVSKSPKGSRKKGR